MAVSRARRARAREGHRCTALLASLALILAAWGCGGDYGLHVEYRLDLNAPSSAQSGATLTFTITNRGSASVTSEGPRFEFLVRDAAGSEIRRIEDPQGRGRLETDDSISVDWDQRDGSGILVPVGDYSVAVRYRAGTELRERSSSLSIG